MWPNTQFPKPLHRTWNSHVFWRSWEFFVFCSIIQMQPSRGDLRKKCSETTLTLMCSIKLQMQLYWNDTSVWVLSCKFAAYFQNTSGRLLLIIDCIYHHITYDITGKVAREVGEIGPCLVFWRVISKVSLQNFRTIT